MASASLPGVARPRNNAIKSMQLFGVGELVGRRVVIVPGLFHPSYMGDLRNKIAKIERAERAKQAHQNFMRAYSQSNKAPPKRGGAALAGEMTPDGPISFIANKDQRCWCKAEATHVEDGHLFCARCAQQYRWREVEMLTRPIAELMRLKRKR